MGRGWKRKNAREKLDVLDSQLNARARKFGYTPKIIAASYRARYSSTRTAAITPVIISGRPFNRLCVHIRVRDRYYGMWYVMVYTNVLDHFHALCRPPPGLVMAVLACMGVVRLLFFGRPYALGEFFGFHVLSRIRLFPGRFFFSNRERSIIPDLLTDPASIKRKPTFRRKTTRIPKGLSKNKVRVVLYLYIAWQLFPSAAIFVFFHYCSIRRSNIN